MIPSLKKLLEWIVNYTTTDMKKVKVIMFISLLLIIGCKKDDNNIFSTNVIIHNQTNDDISCSTSLVPFKKGKPGGGITNIRTINSKSEDSFTLLLQINRDDFDEIMILCECEIGRGYLVTINNETIEDSNSIGVNSKDTILIFITKKNK